MKWIMVENHQDLLQCMDRNTWYHVVTSRTEPPAHVPLSTPLSWVTYRDEVFPQETLWDNRAKKQLWVKETTSPVESRLLVMFRR